MVALARLAVIYLHNLGEKSFSIKPPPLRSKYNCAVLWVAGKQRNSIISPIQTCIIPISYTLIYFNCRNCPAVCFATMRNKVVMWLWSDTRIRDTNIKVPRLIWCTSLFDAYHAAVVQRCSGPQRIVWKFSLLCVQEGQQRYDASKWIRTGVHLLPLLLCYISENTRPRCWSTFQQLLVSRCFIYR